MIARIVGLCLSGLCIAASAHFSGLDFAAGWLGALVTFAGAVQFLSGIDLARQAAEAA